MRLLVLFCLLLSGCTSFLNQLDGSYWSKQDCLTADWRSHGIQDGQAGTTLETAREYYQVRCVDEHQVNPDLDKHFGGYQVGLKVYCTYHGGQKAGFAGRDYQHVCDSAHEPEFLKGYKIGLPDFYQNQILQVDRDIIDLNFKKDSAFMRLQSMRLSSKSPSEIQRQQSELEDLMSKSRDLARARLDYQQKLSQLNY